MTEAPAPTGPDTAAVREELNVGVMLFVSYRAMESAVFEALADAGYADLTRAQARIFQRIGPHGTRLTELAEQAQVTKQTAGFLVDQLERAGYVERTPDPLDARARLVRIARLGLDIQPVAAAAVADVESQWAEHLGAKRWSALRDALSRLRDLTDPVTEQVAPAGPGGAGRHRAPVRRYLPPGNDRPAPGGETVRSSDP